MLDPAANVITDKGEQLHLKGYLLPFSSWFLEEILQPFNLCGFVYLFWCVLKIPFTWAHTGCVGVITATGKSAGLESLVSLWIHHISLGQKRRFLIKRINAIPIENKMKYNDLFPAFWILYCFFMLTLMPGLHLPDLFCLLGHTQRHRCMLIL